MRPFSRQIAKILKWRLRHHGYPETGIDYSRPNKQSGIASFYKL